MAVETELNFRVSGEGLAVLTRRVRRCTTDPDSVWETQRDPF